MLRTALTIGGALLFLCTFTTPSFAQGGHHGGSHHGGHGGGGHGGNGGGHHGNGGGHHGGNNHAIRSFKPLTTFGVQGVAEIVDATGDGNTLVYTNSDQAEVGVVDISDPANPVQVATVATTGEPTSVSIVGDIAVVNVWLDKHDEGNPPPAFNPGKMMVIDLADPTSPVVLGEVAIGWHPDSVKLVERGGSLIAVIAIENEPVVVENGLVTDDDAPGNPNDVSPAGLIQVVVLDLLNPAASLVTDVNLPAADLLAAGCLYENDPQPEFVTIKDDTAAVSLQENNGIAILDITDPTAPVLVRVFTLGIAGERKADLTEDDAISHTEGYPSLIGSATHPMATDGGGNPVPGGVRFPDAIAFAPSSNMIFSADEGELNFTGGRGWSVWSTNGNLRYEDRRIERYAVSLGQYPEGRSENKGVEMEGVTTATFGNRDFAFLLSERGSFMAVYRIDRPHRPQLVQILPTGLSPEGVVAIPARGLVVTADEDSGTLSIFEGVSGIWRPSPSQPRLFGSLHRPFSAISGICAAPGNRLFAVPDNALPTDIFHINVGQSHARVRSIRRVKSNGVQMRYDGEGICRDTSIAAPAQNGWWIASEGNTSSNPNLCVQIDRQGNVIREIQLPASIDAAADPALPGTAQGPAGGAMIRSNGFEGVTLSSDGQFLVVCIQREFQGEFSGDKYTRIARYDLNQLSNSALSSGIRWGGDWEFFFYQMDSNESGNWAGLSEIITIGANQYAVIERDKEIGVGSALKKIYAFTLDGLSADADGTPDATDTVTKVEVLDILDLFFPYEKVEGLAITQNGHLWIALDNDGGELESRLVDTGTFVNPFGGN